MKATSFFFFCFGVESENIWSLRMTPFGWWRDSWNFGHFSGLKNGTMEKGKGGGGAPGLARIPWYGSWSAIFFRSQEGVLCWDSIKVFQSR